MENSRKRIWLWENPRGSHDISTQNRILQKSGVRDSKHSCPPLISTTTDPVDCSAYEIETYWGEVAPPKEILENISAKGGDLRSRTLESFPVPIGTPARVLANETVDADPQDSADEDKLTTPKREKTEPEDQGSAGRYPTRMFFFSLPADVPAEPCD